MWFWNLCSTTKTKLSFDFKMIKRTFVILQDFRYNFPFSKCLLQNKSCWESFRRNDKTANGVYERRYWVYIFLGYYLRYKYVGFELCFGMLTTKETSFISQSKCILIELFCIDKMYIHSIYQSSNCE